MKRTQNHKKEFIIRAMETPVLYICYNRPAFTKRSFGALQSMQPKKIYIAADGPKSDSDKQACETVRQMAIPDWSCILKTKYRKTNVGCDNNIIAAIDWFFAQEPFGIIVEDDCLISSSFCTFVAEMRSAGFPDKKIGFINGFCPFEKLKLPSDYYFSQFCRPWGWATSSKTWQAIRPYIDRVETGVTRERLCDVFQSQLMGSYWYDRFRDYQTGNLETAWDRGLQVGALSKGLLTVIPAKNLIKNFGIGNNATRTTADHPYGHYRTFHFPVNKIRHPALLQPETKLDRLTFKLECGLSSTYKEESLDFVRYLKQQ